MTALSAPLSHFLTCFSAPTPSPVAAVIAPAHKPELTVTMLQVELDALIAESAQSARADAEQHHAAEIESFVTAHETALTEAIAAARAEWVEAAGDRFASLIEAQLAGLRNSLADGIALVLRPLLSEAARSRTMQALTEALDRLLADPSKPLIRISAPEDLLDAVRKVRPATGIEWITAAQPEVTITAGATYIETKLAAALADVATTEISHVS